MINKHHYVIILTIVLFCFPFLGLTQKKATSELTIGVYGGANFLPFKPSEIESNYYNDLKFGYNFGSEIIVFLSDIGLGLVYDESRFSAKDRMVRNYSIDETFRLTFIGPLIASRIKINRENQITFSVSIGKSISANDAIIDGDVVEIRNNSWTQKFSIRYGYHFSDFSINAGIQYVNENKPTRPNLWVLQPAFSFFGSNTPAQYTYTSGIDIRRLTLNVGISYTLKNLFL